MDRLEELAQKLAHPLRDVRLRAASNLLFKLDSGVIDRAMLRGSYTLSVIVKSSYIALSALISRLNEQGSVEHEYLLSLLGILGIIGRIELKDSTDVAVMSKTLGALYDLSTRSDLVSATQAISKAIDAVCSINNQSIQISSDSSGLRPSDSPISGAQNPDKGVGASGSPLRPDPRPLSASRNSGIDGLGSSHRTSHTSKGAGSIMASPLVTAGWKFPPFAFTESDDRYLFDLEVRIKMSQENCHLLVLDSLADFPAQSLLSRRGLLSCLLDVLGAPLLAEDLCSSSGCHPIGADPNGYLTPVAVIDWLGRLLDRLGFEWKQQMEGTLCSTVSSFFGRADGDGTALKMTTAVYRNRYPRHGEPEPASGGTEPAASLPGFAFGVSAAVLPLLRSRDVNLCSGALSLLRKSIRLCIDPLWLLDEQSALSALIRQGFSEEDALEARLEAQSICTERLQHLITRVDQLLQLRLSAVPGHRSFSSTDLLWDILTAAKIQSADAEDSLDVLSAKCCDLCLYAAGSLVLSMLPDVFSAVSPDPRDPTFPRRPEGVPRLVFGSNIKTLLEHVTSERIAIADTDQSDRSFLRALETVDRGSALELVQSLDFVNCFSDLDSFAGADASRADNSVDTDLEYDFLSKAVSCAQLSVEKCNSVQAVCEPGLSSFIETECMSGLEEQLCRLLIKCATHFCVDGSDDGDLLLRLVRALRDLLRHSERRREALCRCVLQLLLDTKQEIESTRDELVGGYFDCMLSTMMIDASHEGKDTFLYSLLVHGLDSSNSSGAALLELMLGYQLNAYSYDEIGESKKLLLASHYSAILRPLQLYVWRSRGIVAPHSDAFLNILKDACEDVVSGVCGDSEDDIDVNIVRYNLELSSMMGLFHEAVATRIETLLRLQGVYNLENELSGGSLLETSSPLASRRYIFESWESFSGPEGSATESGLTFSDLWNLSRVAFELDDRNSGALSASDLPVRQAAARQLASGLISYDRALIAVINDDAERPSSASKSWVIATVTSIVGILRTAKLLIDSDGLVSVSLSEFFLDAASVLSAIVALVPSIHSHLTFFPSDKIPSTVSLRPVLELLCVQSPLASADPVIHIQAACLRLISMWCCSDISAANEAFIPAYAAKSLKTLAPTLASRIELPRLRVERPSPLSFDGRAVRVLETSRRIMRQRQLKSLEDIETSGDRSSNMMDDLSRFLNLCLQTTKNHSSFDRCILLCSCLTVFLPQLHLSLVDPSAGEGMLFSLDNIIQVAPSTISDVVTLHHVLKMVSISVSSLSSAENNLSVDSYMRSMIEFAYSSPIVHLFEGALFPVGGARGGRHAGLVGPSGTANIYCLWALEEVMDLMLRLATNKVSWHDDLLRELITGSPLLVLIARTACTEPFPATLRSRAWVLLEMLVCLYPEVTLAPLEYTAAAYWSCVNGSEGVAQFPTSLGYQPFEKSYILNALYHTSNSSYSAVADVIACARLLRSPDSMVGSSSVFGALKLLQTIHRAKVDPYSMKGQPCLGVSVGSDSEVLPYMWLLRLIHDRRGAVRLLAVDVIDATVNYDLCVQRIVEDECGSHDCDAVMPAPWSNIRHIVLDCSECAAVRSAALRVLSKFLMCLTSRLALGEQELRDEFQESLTAESQLSTLLKIYHTTLSTVVSGVSFCLQQSCCSFAMREGISVFENLLRPPPVEMAASISSCYSELYSLILKLCSPFRLLSSVVATIDPVAASLQLNKDLTQRIINGFTAVQTCLGYDKMTYAQAVRNESSSLLHIGSDAYGQALTHVQHQYLDQSVVVQIMAIRIFLRLAEIEMHTQHNGATSLFGECIRHSKVIYNVISLFSSLNTLRSRITFGPLSMACTELLSAFFLHELRARKDSALLLQPHSFGITDLIRGNAVLISNVTVMNISIITRLAERDFFSNLTLVPEALEQLNSSLRLFFLMLASSEWRMGMCLGPPFPVDTEDVGDLDDPACKLLNALKSVRKLLMAEPTHSFSGVANSLGLIEVVLGLLLHYSYKLRVLTQVHYELHGFTDEGHVTLISESIVTVQDLVFNAKTPPALRLLKSKMSKRVDRDQKVGSSSSNSGRRIECTPPRNLPASDSRSPDSVVRVEGRGRHACSDTSWRGKARSYTVEEPRHTSWYLGPMSRLILWTKLICLLGALRDGSKNHADLHGLRETLIRILLLAPVWLTSGDTDPEEPNSWCPSHAQLLSTALCCLAVSSRAISPESNSDGLITRLISLGMGGDRDHSKFSTLSLQWLSLNLSSFYISVSDSFPSGAVESSLSSSKRTAIARALYRCVQSNLEAHGVERSVQHLKGRIEEIERSDSLFCRMNCNLLSNPLTMSLTLDVLTSIGSPHIYLHGGDNISLKGLVGKGRVRGSGCVVTSDSNGGPHSGNKRNQTYCNTATKLDADQLFPVPSMVHWLLEAYGRQHSVVAAAICRYIGRFGSHLLSRTKLVPAILTSEITLETLAAVICQYIYEPESFCVALKTALVAMWSILHLSEKAISVVKASSFCSTLSHSTLISRYLASTTEGVAEDLLYVMQVCHAVIKLLQ